MKIAAISAADILGCWRKSAPEDEVVWIDDDLPPTAFPGGKRGV